MKPQLALRCLEVPVAPRSELVLGKYLNFTFDMMLELGKKTALPASLPTKVCVSETMGWWLYFIVCINLSSGKCVVAIYEVN